jgi:hypothetical protein
MAKRRIINEGHFLTVWSDGSWKHRDGRFLSMEPNIGQGFVDLMEGATPAEIDGVLIHYFVHQHMKANPQQYR